MAKRKKPWPQFIVEISSGKFYLKTRWPYHDFQDRLRYIVYQCNKSCRTFNRLSSLESCTNEFRRPNQTELLLFDKE